MSTYLADKAENLSVQGPSATFTYRRIGRPGGTPVVLLNRFGATIDWWDPEFLDLLAADHDVILFDTVGTGYSTGEPRDSLDGFADGAIEFIEALGLPQVDLLGWSLGGFVAQRIALHRPELVRKLVVAASGPNGWLPGAPAMSEKVVGIVQKPGGGDADDLLYLFYPDTEAGRAAGRQHLEHISTRLNVGSPAVSETTAQGMFTALSQLLQVPLDQVRAELEAIKHPLLYICGQQDVMMPAYNSYAAIPYLDKATLIIYGDAGHALLFQHAKTFVADVTTFLAA